MEKIKKAAKELQQTTKLVRFWERHPGRPKHMGGNQGPQWAKEAILLVRASERNPALGLYGESQIGKSFLISALATNEEQIFIKDPTSDAQISFLKLLNPGGKGESTGIITRFTSKEGKRNGENKTSFLGELLNYEDLIMAMVHGVHSDVEQAEPPDDFKTEAQAIIKKLKDAKENAQSNSESDKNIQPVESVLLALEQVRILKYFPGYIRILDECKFEKVFGEYSDAEKVPSDDLLAESIALIWGGHKSQPLRDLYTIIHKVLVKLDGSEIMEIPIKDVIAVEGGQQKSLLDVKLLDELFTSTATVNVYGRGTDEEEQDDGKPFGIARASLAAVLSEIVLPVKESANHSEMTSPSLISIGDIIDFPGSRAAGKGTRRQDVKPEEAVSVFLRGKLIQIYRKLVGQNEIGVLCIGVGVTGNPEAGVQNQRAIELWLDQEKMSDEEDPSLLAVVTKCDQLLTKQEAVGAGAVNDFKKVIDKLRKYSAEHYNWLMNWPGYSLETTAQFAGKKKPFKSLIFVFNPRYIKENTIELKKDQELQKYLIDAAQGPDVVRHCKTPDPWVTGLGKKVPNSDDYTGNIQTLKDESCNQLKKVKREASLRRRIEKLLAELKQKFGGMHRREGAVDEKGRIEIQRKAATLKLALQNATAARKRNGLASLLESVEITPAMIEQGISKLKTWVDENDQDISEVGVYEFVRDQWLKKTQRIPNDSSAAIKGMFGESGSHVRQLLHDIPDKYPKFKQNCLAVIDKRFDVLEGRRLEMLCEPLAECWNANILDWGIPIAESLLQGGIAPEGDIRRHPGRWILKHWEANIESLIQSMEDPEGPPPPDYAAVKKILEGIAKTEKELSNLVEDIH